jgi:hypothetical protein
MRKQEIILPSGQPLASPFDPGTAAKKPQSSRKGVLAQMLPFIGLKTPAHHARGRRLPN